MIDFIKRHFGKILENGIFKSNQPVPLNAINNYAYELEHKIQQVLRRGLFAKVEVCYIDKNRSVTAVQFSKEGGGHSVFLCSSYKSAFEHFGIDEKLDFDSKDIRIEGTGSYGIPNGFLLLKGKPECNYTERQAQKDYWYWFRKNLTAEEELVYLRGLLEIERRYS